jgi:hypothetical protein
LGIQGEENPGGWMLDGWRIDVPLPLLSTRRTWEKNYRIDCNEELHHVHTFELEEFDSKKCYKSIFVYSRKMQSKFGIYWAMHYKLFIFWLIKSRWFEQLGYN